jgi:hypothetical protein
VFGPVAMLSCAWLLVRMMLGAPLPFAGTPRFAVPGAELPFEFQMLGLALVYAWSLASYAFVMTVERAREAQLEAAQHGRLAQATRRQNTLAA